MGAEVELSVILPTFNERESLPRLDAELQSAVEGLSAEIVVVDDGSPDGTAAWARGAPGPVPHLVIERAGKMGLASAVVAGATASRGRFLVVMDADGSHPPSAIGPMVGALRDDGAEFALGSRWMRGGSSPGLEGSRRLLSAGAALLARPLVRVSDPMSGLFAVRREVFFRAALAPRGFKIGLEVLVRCRPFPVAEIPITFRDRFAGESKLGRGEIRRYVEQLATLYRDRLSTDRRASSTR
ncbi:MAG: polyprenol monophosphomannose synthase [Thermoplasmata archaeon]